MEFAEFLADFGEDAGDVFVFGDVAGHEEGIGAEGGGEFLDVFLEAFALVGEGKARAGLVPGLGDGPRDGAFVGDAEDDPGFSFK